MQNMSRHSSTGERRKSAWQKQDEEGDGRYKGKIIKWRGVPVNWE